LHELNLKSPLSGILIPIEKVPDQVFAERLVGDGIGIGPTDNILKAPCAGKIVQLHKSHHAVTIETETGVQILLHIGINTVNLKGEGFQPLIKVGSQVSEGQELIKFDADLIARKGLSLVSVMVLLEGPMSKTMQYSFAGADKVAAGETQLATLQLNGATTKTVQQNKPHPSHEQENAYESVPFFVRLPSGMHARPAAQLANLAHKFKATIEFIKGGKTAPIKSIISILGLEIAKDDEIIVLAVGTDCQAAVKSVLQYLVKLEEEELATFVKEQNPPADKKITEIESNERTLVGVSASDGVVIGRIAILKSLELEYPEKSAAPDREKTALEMAIAQATKELVTIEKNLDDTSKAAIFSAHREMLGDSELLGDTVLLINKGHSAAYAWDYTIKNRAQRLESLSNELIAGRANDIRDIGSRVLKKILGVTEKKKEIEENIILVAQDLTPSDTIQLDQSKVLGFCTTSGGATSHVAILARAMGIPAIAGIEDRVMHLKDGQEVILDGDNGALYLNPSVAEKEKVTKRQVILAAQRKNALKHAGELAQTTDGHRIEVVANISGISDAEKSVAVGGEGVGLLRTEFLFLDRDRAPTEKEQLDIYQAIADSLGPRPLVIRTLDIGGDKALNYLPIPREENPFLGVRGIRLCLKKEELFREQLRAILKIQSPQSIHIMFPMVGQLFELRAAKRILEEERIKLDLPTNAHPLKIGIMIEVPSAAIMAEQFAREVDFFSIGTNDLTQYTMAMDRGHNELAKQVDGLHPAVLNLISMTVQAAHKHGKWVGVCGGIASDPKAIPVLIGLGVDELSLSIPNIPLIKAAIRNLNKLECEQMRPQFLSAECGKEVRELVLNKWPQLF